MVLGAGMSGLACCHYLLDQGATVLLADSKSRDALSAEALALEQRGVNLLTDNYQPQLAIWDMVVTSPGVPLSSPLAVMSKKAGIPVIGEIELAFRAASAPFIGITGTNGKTTTTALTAHLLKEAGIKTLVGGNIGKPLAQSASRFAKGYIVAELSSFQLESCDTFRPHIAVHLNLTEDHLDRHHTMEEYAAAKERIFAQQTAEDFAVLNADDPYLRALAPSLKARVRFFSTEEALDDGAYLDKSGRVVFMENGAERYAFPADIIYIKGRHNISNAMAAALAAHAAGADYERIALAMTTFPGVEHRLEFVCEKNGVTYINDSKGTNPDSTQKALLAYDQPLILLMGGYDKGGDFHDLMKLVKERARLIIIYGATKDKLRQAAEDIGVVYTEAKDFRNAVAKAKAAAQPGDMVMLSPACASWDEFENFELRGALFKKLVK